MSSSIAISSHSSEIRGLCLMKCPCEMVQNLPYFINMKTQNCFFRFLVHVDIEKNKVARNEKRKNTIGFHIAKI